MQRTTLPESKNKFLSHTASRPMGDLNFRELPLVSAMIAACALVVGVSPTLSSLLEYDRTAIAGGQIYRLITGQFAHWNFDHLLWDVVMFAALAAFLERYSRRLLVATIALATLVISAAVWLLTPNVLTYRGLSGLDSALFAAVLVVLLADALRWRHKPVAVLVGLLAIAFTAKVGYEMTTGLTLFVDSAKAGFTPLPIAHATGAAVGTVVAGFHCATRRPA